MNRKQCEDLKLGHVLYNSVTKRRTRPLFHRFHLSPLFSFFILFILLSPSNSQSSPIDEGALSFVKNFVNEAQKIWNLEKVHYGNSLLESKKDLYCQLGERTLHLPFISEHLFKRAYLKSEPEIKTQIEIALLNNYTHVFLNQVGEKILYSYDWEKSQIRKTLSGRGQQRSEGYEIKVITWPPQSPRLTLGDSSSVVFEVRSQQGADEKIYSLTDVVLDGFRVSGLYTQWGKDVWMNKRRLEDVLSQWERDHQPNCP